MQQSRVLRNESKQCLGGFELSGRAGSETVNGY